MDVLADLIQQLSRGGDAEREHVARLVAEHGEEAVPALQAALATSAVRADSDTRWWIAAALAQIPGAAASAALESMLSDADEDVRAGVVQVLGERKAGARALITTLYDPSMFVAMQAGYALSSRWPEAVPGLIGALTSGPPQVRAGAARALSVNLSHDAVPALIAALEDDSPAVQFYAELALERMGVGTVLLKPD